jgi:hypothetical protein
MARAVDMKLRRSKEGPDNNGGAYLPSEGHRLAARLPSSVTRRTPAGTGLVRTCDAFGLARWALEEEAAHGEIPNEDDLENARSCG